MKKKTSITLRQRELPSGRIRLYLDVISNGLLKKYAQSGFLTRGTIGSVLMASVRQYCFANISARLSAVHHALSARKETG